VTVDEFIAEWEGKPGGSERSNFAPFIFDLCELLGVPRPGQSEKGKLGEYEFEGSVPKGSYRSLDAGGSIDLYKRRHFIMEAKQSYLKPEQTDLDFGEPQGPRAPSGARYDKLMRDARNQAENYAKNLPASEPVAPFLIVCDIGRAFEGVVRVKRLHHARRQLAPAETTIPCYCFVLIATPRSVIDGPGWGSDTLVVLRTAHNGGVYAKIDEMARDRDTVPCFAGNRRGNHRHRRSHPGAWPYRQLDLQFLGPER
jgi:hypothetical protein